MVRAVLGLLGVLTALLPERMIGVFEDLAVENPRECSTRSWVSPGIRLEGVLVAVASLTGGRAYAWMMNLTGVFGAVVLLFPDLYRTLATRLLYARPADVEWNERFTDGVRIIGALYVLLAVRAFKERNEDD